MHETAFETFRRGEVFSVRRCYHDRVQTDAIIIRTHTYRERDLMVHAYTERAGRVAAIARGALSGGSVQAMHLDRGTMVGFGLVPSKGPPIVTGAHARSAFSALRTEPARMAAAWVLTEAVDALVSGQERDGRLWAFLGDALHRLDRCSAAQILSVLRSVQLGLLTVLGYGPRTEECATCGVPGPESAVFCVQLGGLVCAACSRAGWRGAKLDAEDIRWLAGRHAESPYADAPRRTPAEDLLEYIGGRPLRSLGILFTLVGDTKSRPRVPGTGASGVV